MKRIKTKEEINKGRKRVKFIVGSILIFLMLFSTAGYSLLFGGRSLSGSNQVSNQINDPYYNGQYWVYPIGEQEFYFTNNINSAKEVPVNINFNVNNYFGSNIYIVTDNALVLNEISLNLARYINKIHRACYGPCEEDLPEKNCDENLIIFNEGEENKVYQDQNCIFIEGNLLAVDAFLYRILGIN